MDEEKLKTGCSKSSPPKCPMSRREFLSMTSKLAAGSALVKAIGVVPAHALGSTSGLPSWTSATAKSSVFAVTNVPIPRYSLAGGVLPHGSPAAILSDAGIDALTSLMARQGTNFFRTKASPKGIVACDSVVVIKVNNQWVGAGSGSGAGRDGTSTDLVKGLIWRILNHPEHFVGEVIVAENVQDIGVQDFAAATPSNAQGKNQTLADVLKVFHGMGRPVSLQNWTHLNANLLPGGNMSAGPADCEYSKGNMEDGYVLLNDPTPGLSISNGYSYPKFRSAGGRYVSMRHGVWDGASYKPGGLVLINMPVLKKHCMAAATAAWKNLIGFVTNEDPTSSRFHSWDEMHSYFWGYNDSSNVYGLIGRQMSLVRAPDLNILDAVWVATDNNYDSASAIRCNIVLGSRDPFALDWYASEYVLRPIVPDSPNDSSLARAGIFRSASLVNQKSAEKTWTGTYPFVNFVEGYSGNTPLKAEKTQMNVYVVSAQAPKG